LQAQEGRQSQAVRQVLVAGQSQLLPEQVLVLDVRIDQQHGCRHAIQEYIAASTTSTAAMARG
jgi:hypothetical protein